MVYSAAFENYLSNFKAALVFLLLLIFAVPFYFLGGTFTSSGSIMLDYNFLSLDPIYIIALLIITLLFLFFYSLFVVVMVATVKHEFTKIKIHEYLGEKMQALAFALFVVYAALTLVAVILGSLLYSAGVSAVALNVLWLLMFIAFLFLPQIIVVDDDNLADSIKKNFAYLQQNPGTVLQVLAVAVTFSIALAFLEFFLDYYLFYGTYVTLIIALVFLIPDLETLKTVLYLHKYALISHTYKLHHTHHRRR